MLRQAYSLILLLAVPFILLRLLLKSTATPAYRQRIPERFGFFDLSSGFESAERVLWVHAVSVGEVVAAAPLVKALLASGNTSVLMTTATPTGAERAGALFGDTVRHVYAPYDLGFVVRKFLKRLQPQLLIIMETELWPNTVHYCQRAGVKILLANARLSAKSARGYERLGSMTRTMLQSIDLIAAQAEADRERFIALGAPADRIAVTGSLKFQLDTSAQASLDPLFQAVQDLPRPVVIAASTREGEESKVLDAWEKLKGNPQRPLLLLVPRHPERFDEVAALGERRGWRLQRRSEAQSVASDTDILLGDSMGEMLAYYKLADIAFVGGSLVETGCQNVLEPAAMGLPVVVGPSQFNFAHICQQLESAGGLQTVPDSSALATAITKLLNEPELRQRMGAAGRKLVAANQQALPRMLELVGKLTD